MGNESPFGAVIGPEGVPDFLEPLTELVVGAAAAILAVNQRSVSSRDKTDGSPVTEADLAADKVIVDGLISLYPRIPVVSEERADAGTGPYPQGFFIVDPLDGTKEFIGGHNDYTVNVALICAGRPLLGIICAPALGLIWRGVVGQGAERLNLWFDKTERLASRTPIQTRPLGEGPWVAAVSRSHGDPRTDAFIDRRKGATRLKIGSALKFCRVAEGTADIYPRLSTISEWDIAAGHAIVEAAGGAVLTAAGRPLSFGQRRGNFSVSDFVVWGDPSQAARG